MKTPSLILENIGVRLGGRQILDGIDASIEPGEFIGIFGPNGAGKSTLIRAILGLCPVSDGSIRVLGLPPRAARSGIGYMPQARANFEGTALSARAMVSAVYEGRRWGIPWKSRVGSREVDRALHEAGASDYADHPFGVLSGGEKQRITLAQALLGQPKMLILDEPLASLDPKNQSLLVDRIEQIRRDTGATVLFIAHDLNPLLHCMSRVWYLAKGHAEIGKPGDVVNSECLSRLYGSPIEVIRTNDRIFILSQEHPVTEAARHA